MAFCTVITNPYGVIDANLVSSSLTETANKMIEYMHTDPSARYLITDDKIRQCFEIADPEVPVGSQVLVFTYKSLNGDTYEVNVSKTD